jgi:hypothetical protein
MVRPANHPRIAIMNWDSPKAKEVRNIWRRVTIGIEMLPLRATAKQSADKPTAIKRIEINSIMNGSGLY